MHFGSGSVYAVQTTQFSNIPEFCNRYLCKRVIDSFLSIRCVNCHSRSQANWGNTHHVIVCLKSHQIELKVFLTKFDEKYYASLASVSIKRSVNRGD